jgi:hypothetical protein
MDRFRSLSGPPVSLGIRYIHTAFFTQPLSFFQQTCLKQMPHFIALHPNLDRNFLAKFLHGNTSKVTGSLVRRRVKNLLQSHKDIHPANS